MNSVAYLSHADCGRHDTGWGHPEHVGRLRAIPRALRHDVELFHLLDHRESRHASADELALAHDPAYVATVRDLAQAGGGRLDADTVVSEGSWDAATAGAGAVLDGIDLAFGEGPARSFCAVRPPGHHALRAAGMGFCLFGNVALGAHYARQRHGAERVLIVDWDVHHGNGTQAAAGFTPDLVLISAGFDSLAGDPLGSFTLEMDDVHQLTREIVSRAEIWCGGRVVSALEGGYAPDRLGEACVRHMRALL